MIRDNDRLYDLTDTNSPAESLAEIINILLLIDPPPDPSPIEKIYADILRLFTENIQDTGPAIQNIITWSIPVQPLLLLQDLFMVCTSRDRFSPQGLFSFV